MGGMLGFLMGVLAGAAATWVMVGVAGQKGGRGLIAPPSDKVGANQSAELDRLRAALADLQSRLTTAEEARAAAEAALAAAPPPSEPPPATPTEPVAPVAAPSAAAPASDGVDDLTRIKGIGPVLRDKLQGLGIRTYRQIADLTAADTARLDDSLNLRGRIEREDWIAQARALIGR